VANFKISEFQQDKHTECATSTLKSL